MPKLCLYCGEPIYGRSDKKFCNDNCRNNYNYNANHEQVNVVRNINNALGRNRRILKELNPEGKAVVTKQMLYDKGFNFKYFTNIYQTKSGNTYYVVYDQAYSLTTDNKVVLVENANL